MTSRIKKWLIDFLKPVLKELLAEEEQIRERIKKRKVIVLYDFDNIHISLQTDSKVVDFGKLRKKIIKDVGEISFAWVFMPTMYITDDYYKLLRRKINDEGFRVIACEKESKRDGLKIKKEDTVDSDMYGVFREYLDYDVTDIVIVSGDKHMVDLVKEAHNKNRIVHIYGTDKISYVLKDLVEHIDKVPI